MFVEAKNVGFSIGGLLTLGLPGIQFGKKLG